MNGVSGKLREKLHDPDFRRIEGFPIGTDEDILAQSDPPYYTASPNPFLPEFIQRHSMSTNPMRQTSLWPRPPAWRIGRVDRVRSQSERRLTALVEKMPDGDELLQVYFPHLEDTVEVLQVQRVLERMNVFLRLMHEGLTTDGREERSIDAGKEFARGLRLVPQIRERLTSAFPVRAEPVGQGSGVQAVDPCMAGNLWRRPWEKSVVNRRPCFPSVFAASSPTMSRGPEGRPGHAHA